MFPFSQINLRRIATVFFASITLFFTVALIGNTPAIAADSITRDVTELNSVDKVDDAAYESMKAGRQQKQARRSQQAEDRAEREIENETVSEKLNLDEALPRSTKKFVEQVTEDEPIDNKTRP